MAGLQDAAAFGGAGDEVVGLGEGSDERLFNEQVEARIEQGRCYGVMVDGGNGDGGRMQAEVGAEEFVDRGEDGDGELVGRFGCAGGVRLDGGDEGNSLPRRLKFAVDTEVVAAKCAVPGDGNAEDGAACDLAGPGWKRLASVHLPSTALRQRV